MGQAAFVIPFFLNSSVKHLGPSEMKLLWLVRLRSLALFSQIPLSILGRYYGYIDQASHVVFAIILVALLCYNAHLYRRIVLNEVGEVSDFFLSAQVTLDLVVFTVLLGISGSSNNPFYALFYVMAILGGIFSAGRSSHLFFLILLCCITAIQLQPTLTSSAAFSSLLSPQTLPYLLSQVLIPSVAFLIARSFGELFNEGQQRLVGLTLHTERLDRLRALGSLSAGFSHEFASPLQNAKLRLARFLAAKEGDKADLEECRRSIQDCEEVLRRMNFSQLHFSDHDFEIVSLPDLTKQAIETWKETSPLPINFSAQDGEVRVHRINFVQAVFNLLDNAADVTPPGAEISVRILSAGSVLSLIISDSGPGFKHEVLERIGEPFNTTKEKGTGLGLYSTQLFMNSIGGGLRVRNLETGGSSVELTFPRWER